MKEQSWFILYVEPIYLDPICIAQSSISIEIPMRQNMSKLDRQSREKDLHISTIMTYVNRNRGHSETFYQYGR